jgi:hypothetical protein
MAIVDGHGIPLAATTHSASPAECKLAPKLSERFPVGSVGGHPIPRRIGENRGGVISAVHHSPVKIWAGVLGAA